MIPKVDPGLCIGCGNCELLCPRVFTVHNDGISYVIKDSDCEEEGCCEEAAEECPAGAIKLTDERPSQ
ncbi:MAG: ferredoxin [Candidatus Aquicultor sp.]|nr:ferredoxin [Candidatus Aquicultor sp.]